MSTLTTVVTWLESRWLAPAYGGWVLVGLALFFFAAATNTMAGWLYVISGGLLALLSIAGILPPRSLRGLQVSRLSIRPVSAGEPLQVTLRLENTASQSKAPLQICDELPASLATADEITTIAVAPGTHYQWRYEIPTRRRGLYRWSRVRLRTAAPLGLFWCRRYRQVPAVATVYPQILPLTHCPLLDRGGEAIGQQWTSDYTSYLTSEGLTRSLRPYRWGDPTRLIHWRTSARYGELRVRELEQFTAGHTIIIALDITSPWQADGFEQAVIAAASLYIYADRQGFSAHLWTATTGRLSTQITVLSALAAIYPQRVGQTYKLPNQPVIWLSPGAKTPQPLPVGSHHLCWGTHPSLDHPSVAHDLRFISTDLPLQPQLQAP
ncbi:hypothetical protein XM38_000970 [Halomicronema hongdechloris C2206]|uniref:DUF58 domain-containing protein n=1 Tax=Halomicronema hongdechloris C2206 TaxID=1641165 RepID=A0A1Z3HFZ0_9CYAN|nr:DUF58 domain-containing protein [Halomicronema hongdechloris]ASC69171.1 hypothetical protein XM38_000970 [Halomicronema hongdechloris C2206]